MIRTGLNGGLNKKDMLVGCFTLIFIFAASLAAGVWLQKEVLGIFRLEERVDRIESHLSE
jgi:hypothetical protein